MDIKFGIESEFYKIEFEIKYENSFKLEIILNKLLLSSFYLTNHLVLGNTISIIKFNIIFFSLLTNLITTIID